MTTVKFLAGLNLGDFPKYEEPKKLIPVKYRLIEAYMKYQFGMHNTFAYI